jgi:hypothetical protein
MRRPVAELLPALRDDFKKFVGLGFLDDACVDLLSAETADEGVSLNDDDWYAICEDPPEECVKYLDFGVIDEGKACLGYFRPLGGDRLQKATVECLTRAGELIGHSLDGIVDCRPTRPIDLWCKLLYEFIRADEFGQFAVDADWFPGDTLWYLLDGRSVTYRRLHRYRLSCTLAKASVTVLDRLMQLKPILKGTEEWRICNALMDGVPRMQREIVAKMQSGKTLNSNIRTLCSALLKSGALRYQKRPGPKGYVLTLIGRWRMAFGKSQE